MLALGWSCLSLVFAMKAEADEALHHLDLPQEREQPMYLNLWRKHKADSEDETRSIGDHNRCPRTQGCTNVTRKGVQHILVVPSRPESSHSKPVYDAFDNYIAVHQNPSTTKIVHPQAIWNIGECWARIHQIIETSHH